ncbi:MAG: sulfur carrier protein ThiS [Burkholderiales bacterium]|nr:sulfur carrier protein ThiS [Burkholderiales bacterium]
MIHITINGETRQFDQSINIAQFIDENNLQGKRIAIERNGEIVPRSQFTEQFLADGDRLEVVVAVGGG